MTFCAAAPRREDVAKSSNAATSSSVPYVLRRLRSTKLQIRLLLGFLWLQPPCLQSTVQWQFFIFHFWGGVWMAQNSPPSPRFTEQWLS